jgi:astacin
MERGTVKKGYLSLYTEELVPVEYTETDGLAIYQGDIILGTAEEMEKLTKMVDSASDLEKYRGLTSNIITASGKIWPNGRIPYEFDDPLEENKIIPIIGKALTEIKNFSLPIEICKRTDDDKNYICFYKSNGCSSYVGMQGGRQPVNISENASYGNVMHELCHAAGLWHEHSREDRDGFIIINTGNIISGMEGNFAKTGAAGLDYGDYDYDSIMHYGAYAFAKIKNIPTISPNQSAPQIGQRDHLSTGDIVGFDGLYLDPPGL